jgi:voltage-gated potassium channel
MLARHALALALIVPLAGGCALAGRTLKDSRLRQDLGVIIVAIKKPDGKMVFNPAPEVAIEPGDLLITLGHREQLERLEAMARA